MKKVYVGILASHGEPYDSFRKVWLRNIEHTLNLGCEVSYKFYFIYGGDTEDIVRHKNHVDLYYSYPETIPNMLRKTLRFFDHVEEDILEHGLDSDNVYILRTNLSTLFNFHMYQDWLQDTTSQMFFGGSIIDGFQGRTTVFSGTNMVMSRDVMQFVLLHQDRFSYKYNEDIELSAMVMLNTSCKLKAMKRLDFLHDKVIYHKCDLFSEDVCCYRFKSSDRKSDVTMMYNILACLQAGVNVTRFIQAQLKHLQMTTEASGMAVLAEKVWVVTPDAAKQID